MPCGGCADDRGNRNRGSSVGAGSPSLRLTISELAGGLAPTAFSEHEYRTLERLTDLIIPVENGAPGALAAGAAAWIDMLAGVNGQLREDLRRRLSLARDDAARQREAADFLSLSSAQQTEMLDADRIPPQRDARARAGHSGFSLGYAG